MMLSDEMIDFIEHATICGYSFKELIIFAEACRMQNISEDDLHSFCMNASNAYEYMMEKIKEEWQKELEGAFS